VLAERARGGYRTKLSAKAPCLGPNVISNYQKKRSWLGALRLGHHQQSLSRSDSNS
jgi:hypothetical protein